MTEQEVCEVPGLEPIATSWQPKNPILRRVVELLSIDLRSLAAFRISIALVLICDLIVRARDLQAHYTDFGVLPRAALLDLFLHPWLWSVHLMSGALWWQALLFVIHGVFLLMLLVGYRTRLATIVSWFLLVSLHSRNPMVLQGGDVLLRMLFFWAMWLPLGARYSVDSAMSDQAPVEQKNFFSMASIAILVQVALVYVFSVIHKDEQNWWHDATAIYYAFSIDPFAEPLARQILKFPQLMKLLSRSVYLLQAVGPWALFFPFWNGLVRTIVVFLFLGFHLSMTQLLAIGPFPWISSASMLVFLPGWFWDKVFTRLRQGSGGQARLGLKIYYDLDCGFCRTSVVLLRTFLLLPETTIAPAQNEAAVAAAMRCYNSWVVIDGGAKQHVGFEAFISLMEHSPLVWWLAPFFRLPLFQRGGEHVYRRVSGNRSFWSRLLLHLKPVPLRLSSSLPGNLTVGVLLVCVIWWNLNGAFPKRFTVNDTMRWLALVLDFDQKWNMFASPLAADGWYVIPGKLINGQTVDVYTGRSYLDYTKPATTDQFYPNQRWQKYMMNLYSAANRPYLLFYGKYLCRNWNARHTGGEQLANFHIVFVQELTLPNYTSAPPKPITLSDHFCFEPPPNHATL